MEKKKNYVYQDYSEIIAKQMVEKFISYAITEIKRKEHKSSILPFCNKYIEGFLWKTLSMENIFFENLEFKPESKEIYLDNMYYGKDDWMIIHEPGKPIIDRHACSFIKIHKTNNLIRLYDEIPETYDLIIDKNIEKEENIKQIIPKKQLTKTLENQLSKSLRIKDDKASAPQVDLNRIELFEDDEEIIKVRLSKFEEWRRLEEEVKKKLKGEKEFNDKNMEIMKKNKELINKLVTADSNGSPIYIKSPVPEKMSNDFLMTKSIISDKIISFTEEDRNKSIKEKEDKNPKQTINPESLIINNSNVNINTNKNIPNNPKFNAIHTSTMASANLRQSILKASHEKHNDISRIVDTRYANSTIALPSQITFLQPMGSNYDFIVPDVGVTIYEGSKVKSGGQNFSSIFKKPSKYDYLSIMKDTVSKNNYSSTGKFDPINDHSTEVKNEILKISTSLPRLTLNSNKEKIIAPKNFNEGISVSKGLQTSLKNTLDKLDLIPEYDNKVNDMMFRFSNQNLFKSMKTFGNSIVEIKEKEKVNNFEAINKFNYSIVNNISWGREMINTKSKSIDMNLTKMPSKPNIKGIEKELGKNIVKSIMPRSRMFSLVKSKINSNQNSMNNSTMTSVFPSINKL